jgi:hypothetical protein
MEVAGNFKAHQLMFSSIARILPTNQAAAKEHNRPAILKTVKALKARLKSGQPVEPAIQGTDTPCLALREKLLASLMSFPRLISTLLHIRKLFEGVGPESSAVEVLAFNCYTSKNG